MMKSFTYLLAFVSVLSGAGSLFSADARADYDSRFSIGLGIAQLKNPSETEFSIGAEYEYRLDPVIGLGASGNYIFSTPGTTFLAVPEVFVHPFSTDFLLSAAPLFEFGGLTGTHVGCRLGTRLPIPLGVIALVPTLAVDLISGGPNYIIGLGIEI
jgi:hypothetical protein